MWPSSGRAPSSASRAALQTLGYTILEARDGDEALQCFMSHAGPIHLLITDVVMPRMSGRRLADLLLASRPGLKVLFISGYTDDAVVRHGLLDAGVAFLQKPFTPSVLAQKVLHVLDQRQAFGVRRKPLPPTPSPQRRGGASQITSFLLPLSVAGRGEGVGGRGFRHGQGGAMNGSRLLRAFAHRNFRLYFFGQGVSLIGTWMQQVAISWVVWRLTSSPKWLGVVAFAGQIPALLLSPIAGVLVDHWNRHRLLLLTQTLAMLQAFALVFLALAGVLTEWPMAALSLFLGIVNAFDMTARQAFLTEMVASREDLANAIALNSSLVNATRLVGPALAGLVLSLTGELVCFLVNGISYLAVLAALLAMRVAPRPLDRHRVPLVQGLREGFTYAFGFAPIRAILLLLALTSLMSMAYTVLLPVFAAQVLQGDAGTLGMLTAGAGLGALIAAVALTARRSVVGLGKWIALAPSLFGLGLIGFSFSRALWVSAPLLAVVGFALMLQMAASNTLLQTLTAEDKRGRVMSYYTMAFLGMAPLGSLLGGMLADVLGAPMVVRLAGACCIAGSLLFALQLPRLRALVRPLYVQMGILPEVTVAVQGASALNVPPERT